MAGKPLKLLAASNLAAVEPVDRTVLLRGKENEIGVEVERFDLERITAAQLAKAMIASDYVAQAVRVAQAISTQRGARSEEAIYLINGSNPAICKIGVAGDPLARLKQLQTSHWDALAISGLLWFYGSPYPTETRAKQFAAAMGASLRGEWVRLSVADAANLVAEAALSSGERIADSGMWLRNRARLLNVTTELSETDGGGPEWKLGLIRRKYGNIANFSDRKSN